MGDPRNPKRKFELWDHHKLTVMDNEVHAIAQCAPYVTFSGGWAWHYMSPPHTEYKLLHDHKDIDLFVPPFHYQSFCVEMTLRGYERVWTRFDADSKGSFYRWQRTWYGPTKWASQITLEELRNEPKPKMPVKIIIDAFLREVPRGPSFRDASIKVVDPTKLITFYGEIHSTDDCVAVVEAHKLALQGISPLGHPNLVRMPE